MHSRSKLFVYDVNGTFVKTADLSSEILTWMTFTSFADFDYIAFANYSGEVGYFEVYYPDCVKEICKCRDVILISHELEKRWSVIVTKCGKVFRMEGLSPSASER
jgi:hypothetical protein